MNVINRFWKWLNRKHTRIFLIQAIDTGIIYGCFSTKKKAEKYKDMSDNMFIRSFEVA
jgi:hypothetical protein